jgi:hypothetical protein
MLSVKFLILNVLFTGVLFGGEYEAKKITKIEYDELQKIDKTIYSLATKTKEYDNVEVANYIYQNLAYDLDFSRLKITSSANLRQSSSDTIYNNTDLTTDRNSYSAGISLTYPLFDKKESNDRKKEIISLKQKIIKEVQSYFKLKSKLDDLKLEYKILTALEIRTKARKLDGVGGFKDWLNVLKDIKKTNHDITDTSLELSQKMQILLSYVKPLNEMKLKGML